MCILMQHEQTSQTDREANPQHSEGQHTHARTRAHTHTHTHTHTEKYKDTTKRLSFRHFRRPCTLEMRDISQIVLYFWQ